MQQQQTFAAYRLERKLGKGGMASVYKASHVDTGQEVALKILHEQFSDDMYIRKRLEHEASIASELKHPNIVPVWDFGEFKRRPYLVMPFLEGGSLAEWFSTPRSLKHEVTLEILGCLANALDYAHSDGVIHRDIKLENILLDKNNVPAISDFGIAQATNTTRITRTGQVLGTPQYLAPEHFMNDEEPDFRGDLYSFGVMAYLLLTGFFPFTGRDGLAIIVKQRDHALPPPSLVNRALPKALDAIFERALAKNPDGRYPTALDFVGNMDAAFYNVPSIATTVFLNSPNPIATVQIAIHQSQNNSNMSILGTSDTLHLPSDTEMIPAATIADVSPPPAAQPKAKPRNIAPFMLLGLVLACAGLGIFTMGMNYFFGSQSRSNETILVDNLELSEEASASPTPTNTATGTATNTPTATRTPSATSTFTATSTGTVTATYTPSRTPTRIPTRRVTSSPTAIASPTVNLGSGGGGSSGGGFGNPTSRPTNRPRPTRTNTPVPPTNTHVPTFVPPDTDTPVPPTDVPPTDPPPPTDIPPTDVPPTDVPPTDPPPPTQGNGVESTQPF